MNAFTSGFRKTTDAVGQGVGGIASGLGNILSRGTATQGGGDSKDDGQGIPVDKSGSYVAPQLNAMDEPRPATSMAPQETHGGLFGNITSGVTAGASAVMAPTADAAKSGAALAWDATGAGLTIGHHIAKSGLDIGSDVVTGTASLTGTALGGVVAAAADTSGVVFQPIGSGLKAIEGLDKLGQQGVEAINGLSLGAVRKVSELTKKALNMSGKTPTFFDPDADGVVAVLDTIKGLVLLGLDEKNAKYAAYALHAVFSYSTSSSWIPALNTSLPIHVAKMGTTHWGKNWGSFDRLDWVDDVKLDDFFAPKEKKKAWKDYLMQARQGFGILLLLFEWGTTWPFYLPPVPAQEIPFAGEIGTVVRKAILPTIQTNFKKAKAADPAVKNKPSKMPSEDPPEA